MVFNFTIKKYSGNYWNYLKVKGPAFLISDKYK